MKTAQEVCAEIEDKKIWTEKLYMRSIIRRITDANGSLTLNECDINYQIIWFDNEFAYNFHDRKDIATIKAHEDKFKELGYKIVENTIEFPYGRRSYKYLEISEIKLFGFVFRKARRQQTLDTEVVDSIRITKSITISACCGEEK